jgi:hypothetical protein
MKIPAAKSTPKADPQIPQAYLLMAAAHMQQNLGKQVFAQPGQAPAPQPTVVKAPDATDQ